MKQLLILFFSFFNLVQASQDLELQLHNDNITPNTECYMGVDIGGTNCRFGFFGLNERNKPSLLFSLTTKTKNVNDFNTLLAKVLTHAENSYGITAENICIGSPGVTTEKKDFSSVHGIFDIKKKTLIKNNPHIKNVFIINDLFASCHGIDIVDEKNIIQIYGNEPKKQKLRSLIGIGTGIGSSLLVWDSATNSYIPQPGEAGLLEFSPINTLEYNLANHVKEMCDSKAVYWAAFASGSGIRRIYSMLKLMNKYNDSLNLDVHDPKVISTHLEDELCKATVDLFIKMLGRFIRGYAFATLPYGGLYIAGGVVNPDSLELFTKNLPPEYSDCPAYLKKILDEIPVYIINDNTLGMYGAVQYLLQNLNANAIEEK